MPPRGGNRRLQEKAKDFKGTWKRMIRESKADLVLIIFIILFSIISAVFALINPILLRDILSADSMATMFESQMNGDSIRFLIHWDVFYTKFGTIIGILVLGAIIDWFAGFLAVSVSGKYAYRMRDRVQKKIERLPLSYFDKVPYGDTLSIGTNDVDNISRNLQSIITQLFRQSTLFIGSIVAMLVVDYRLAFVAFATLPFTIAIVALIGKFSGKQFVKYRRELGSLNGQIEEDYSGFNIIKLFNKEDDKFEEFAKVNKNMEKSDHLSQFLSGIIFPATNFINNLGYVGIAVVAGIIADPATMVSFFLFLDCFSRPFQQIGQLFSTFQSVAASAERIYLLLDEPEIEKDKEDAIDDEEAIQGNFKFDNVYFQYVNEKPLIEKFSLDIKAGDTVAIVGPTGAGKTTMVNLIMRFYEISNANTKNELLSGAKYLINKMNESVGNPQIKEDDLPFDDNLSLDENRNILINYIKEYAKGYEISNDINFDEVVNLIPNLLSSGNIYLDDKPLKDYKVDTLRESIGMVLQDTWLFKGTIRDNLLFGDQSATEEEINNALKQAHIYHFVQTLPGNLDYVLNEDGTNISQGQRQLLTIARAIISKPKILILDEATSSVDTRTEQKIQDALDTIMKNRTSFVIAHRLSTIKNAKLIIVMKKGNIVEVGNHQELLNKNGFYADLYNSQFSGVNPMENYDKSASES